MRDPVAELSKQALIAYEEHITKRWEEMPIGLYLCIHDNFQPKSDWKTSYTVESHFMETSSACYEKGVKKTQIGPKGPTDIKE